MYLASSFSRNSFSLHPGGADLVMVFNMKFMLTLFLAFALAATSTRALSAGENANCSIGMRSPGPSCASGEQCVLYDEGNLPVDIPAKGNCRTPNNNTCFDKTRGLYFAANTHFSGKCSTCKCAGKGGKIKCPPCVPAGGQCNIGGFIKSPPCEAGYPCVIYFESKHPDAGSTGKCEKPNRDTCFDIDRMLYFAPGTILKASDCGACTCPAEGGQLECSSCVRGGGNCSVGGFIKGLQPCQKGYECVLSKESNHPDIASNGYCKIPNRDTCFDTVRNLYFAPKAKIQNTECGPCRCSSRRGKISCSSCVRAGAKCSVGAYRASPELECQQGYSCVVFNEAPIPDMGANGICKKPDQDTCFNPRTLHYLAPNATVPLSDCGSCKCSPTGGELECEKCKLTGDNCTVGGRFATPPLKCASGTQCVLYNSGNLPADVPAKGICQQPNEDTCYDGLFDLYYAPNATMTNGCGQCQCNPSGGQMACSMPIATCLIDPCLGAECPKAPEATCVSDYCGGCNYKFILPNGETATC